MARVNSLQLAHETNSSMNEGRISSETKKHKWSNKSKSFVKNETVFLNINTAISDGFNGHQTTNW